MAKKICTVLFSTIALGVVLYLWGQEEWFQYFVVVAAWDLIRTFLQTWYLRNTLIPSSDKACQECGKKST